MPCLPIFSPLPTQDDMNLWIKNLQESGTEESGSASPGKKIEKRAGSGIFGKRRSKNLDKEKEEKK